MARTKEVADRINVSPATIRIWTADDGPFAQFISADARGTGGRRQRYFSQHDTRILAHAKRLSDDGKTLDQIADELARMQADDWQALPVLPSEDSSAQLVTADAAALAVGKAQTALLAVQTALDQEKTDHAQTRAILMDTRQELGVALGQLKERHPADWWLRIVLAVAALVAILTAVIVLLASSGAV
jgi:DNA-binding transcriptional MerR regulator